MALIGRGKEELMVELAEARGELKSLRGQVQWLEEQLRRTQDALIAKESPAAYNDQKLAEQAAVPLSPAEIEERGRMRKQAEMDRRLLENMEQPLFKSAEDLQAMLLGVLSEPAESRSLHNDGES